MQPHVAHEIVGIESRPGPGDAGAPHRGREHEIAGLIVAHGALHRREVRAEAIVRPFVETDLPHGGAFAEQDAEVRLVRVTAGRAPEPYIGRIIDVMEDSGAAVDTAVYGVVPEVRNH